jgi:hypothetical protein
LARKYQSVLDNALIPLKVYFVVFWTMHDFVKGGHDCVKGARVRVVETCDAGPTDPLAGDCRIHGPVRVQIRADRSRGDRHTGTAGPEIVQHGPSAKLGPHHCTA